MMTIMELTEIKSEVKTLSKQEKYLLIQFIISDLVQEEEKLVTLKHGGMYPVWSPYEATEAAETLFHHKTT